MFWKIPPQVPAALPATITSATYAIGTADHCENLSGGYVATDLKKPPASLPIGDKTALFAWTEIHGNRAHHVYLRDDGDEIPATIQANYDFEEAKLDAEIARLVDPEAVRRAEVTERFAERKASAPEHLHAKLDALRDAELAQLTAADVKAEIEK